jgi:alcohol dehydrogenase class IV
MRFNLQACGGEYAELAPHVFTDIDMQRDSQAIASEFIERLGRLNVELGLEAGLSKVGISASDIPRLASDAMKQTRLLVNNPCDLSEEDAARIYEASL